METSRLPTGAVQAGVLGHSLAEYRARYVEPFELSNSDIHLFQSDGVEVVAIFYKDHPIIVHVRKEIGDSFSNAEIQIELQRHQEGSAWNLEGALWVNENGDDTMPSAMASVNEARTRITIISPAAMMERNSATIASVLDNLRRGQGT